MGKSTITIQPWLPAFYQVSYPKQNLLNLHQSSYICTAATLFCMVICLYVSILHFLSRGTLNHFGSLVLRMKPGIWQVLNLCLLNWITGNKHILWVIIGLFDVKSLRWVIFHHRSSKHIFFSMVCWKNSKYEAFILKKFPFYSF